MLIVALREAATGSSGGEGGISYSYSSSSSATERGLFEGRGS